MVLLSDTGGSGGGVTEEVWEAELSEETGGDIEEELVV